MAKRRVYGRPPLVEALCQFQFEPGRAWDIAVPGLLYNKVKADFPERRQQKEFEFLVDQGTSEVKHQSGERIQFVRPDNSALIQVGPDLLIVNILNPYPGWDLFRELLRSTLEHYCSVADPVGVKSMALRYINHIRIASPSVEIEDYLQFSPRIPPALPQLFTGWTQFVGIPINDMELLRITAGSVTQTAEQLAFMLDIEFVTMQTNARENLLLEADKAHEMIEDAFEACITDRARSMFQEEEVAHEHAQL